MRSGRRSRRERSTRGPSTACARRVARARSTGSSRAQMIVGGIVGGFIADYEIALPWLIAAVGFGATGAYAMAAMHERPPASRPTWSNAHRSIAGIMRASVSAVRTTAIVRLLCLLTAAAAIGIMPVHFL